MYLVYCHTNLINGKQYVGLTSTTLEERAGTDGTRYRGCGAFWSAIKKYGWNNFGHVVLAQGLTHEKACELERYYIKTLNTMAPNGYNLTEGGDSGFHHTEHSKRLLSEKLRGNKSRTGYKNSESHVRKMSEYMRGNNFGSYRRITEEYKHKTMLAQPNRVIILQLTTDDKILAEFDSLQDAERHTGIRWQNISKVVSGKRGHNTAGGYKWKRKGK